MTSWERVTAYSSAFAAADASRPPPATPAGAADPESDPHYYPSHPIRELKPKYYPQFRVTSACTNPASIVDALMSLTRRDGDGSGAPLIARELCRVIAGYARSSVLYLTHQYWGARATQLYGVDLTRCREETRDDYGAVPSMFGSTDVRAALIRRDVDSVESGENHSILCALPDGNILVVRDRRFIVIDPYTRRQVYTHLNLNPPIWTIGTAWTSTATTLAVVQNAVYLFVERTSLWRWIVPSQPQPHHSTATASTAASKRQPIKLTATDADWVELPPIPRFQNFDANSSNSVPPALVVLHGRFLLVSDWMKSWAVYDTVSAQWSLNAPLTAADAAAQAAVHPYGGPYPYGAAVTIPPQAPVLARVPNDPFVARFLPPLLPDSKVALRVTAVVLWRNCVVVSCAAKVKIDTSDYVTSLVYRWPVPALDDAATATATAAAAATASASAAGSESSSGGGDASLSTREWTSMTGLPFDVDPQYHHFVSCEGELYAIGFDPSSVDSHQSQAYTHDSWEQSSQRARAADGLCACGQAWTGVHMYHCERTTTRRIRTRPYCATRHFLVDPFGGAGTWVWVNVPHPMGERRTYVCIA